MDKTTKVLHWSPRILCIMAISFISLFALDSFGPDLTIWYQIASFLIHLIPTFVLLTLLIIAWKWEGIGGIFFTIIGFGMSIFFGPNLVIILTMTIPFVVVGVLFIISYFRKKRGLLKTNNSL
jgi:hypothetical protein